MRNHCKAFRTAKTQTNTVNPITIELIQVFIITASCFKENHTCVDILGMLFVILHITFHHNLQWNLIPGGKNQHSEKKNDITAYYFAVTLFCWLWIEIIGVSLCIVKSYIHIFLSAKGLCIQTFLNFCIDLIITSQPVKTCSE